MESHHIRVRISKLLRRLLQKPAISARDLRHAGCELMDLAALMQSEACIDECRQLVDAVFYEKPVLKRQKATLSEVSEESEVI